MIQIMVTVGNTFKGSLIMLQIHTKREKEHLKLVYKLFNIFIYNEKKIIFFRSESRQYNNHYITESSVEPVLYKCINQWQKYKTIHPKHRTNKAHPRDTEAISKAKPKSLAYLMMKQFISISNQQLIPQQNCCNQKVTWQK